MGYLLKDDMRVTHQILLLQINICLSKRLGLVKLDKIICGALYIAQVYYLYFSQKKKKCYARERLILFLLFSWWLSCKIIVSVCF